VASDECQGFVRGDFGVCFAKFQPKLGVFDLDVEGRLCSYDLDVFGSEVCDYVAKSSVWITSPTSTSRSLATCVNA
jgi:hypothetical protein